MHNNEFSTRIAFHLMGGKKWTVGPVYLKNLFYALAQTHENKTKLHLLAPIGAEDYENDLGLENVIFYGNPRRPTLLWAINGLGKRLLSRDIAMERFLRKYQINVLFGSLLTHRYSDIATLSWFPDFQHVHLPKMFSEAERIARDRLFLHCAKTATRIILMSEAVKKDFLLFAPEYAHKVRVLHPISFIPESIYESDLNFPLNQYHLPEKFFYLPNQFWKHKNHELVFQAVQILKDKDVKVSIVCTGNPSDYRDSMHFVDICRKLSEFGIRDQVIYLGLIPREHVLLLMRQSISVLNPSLFEGWGYTVDEARSVGKQVLLSDIPSHREQNPPKAVFFNPNDCKDLADKLEQIWLSTEPGPDLQLEFEARGALPKRLRLYGDAFFSVAGESLQEV